MSRRRLYCALIATLPVVSLPVIASADDSTGPADEAGHFYVDPYAGAIRDDAHRDTQRSNWLFGLGVGYNISPEWTVELNGNETRLHDRYDDGHLHLYGLSADILRVFNRDKIFAPYIDLGAGALRETPSLDPSATRFSAEGGVGAFIKLWHSASDTASFSLKPDIKARWDDSNGLGRVSLNPGSRWDYFATLGFVFTFGPGKVAQTTTAAPPPPPPPPPAEPTPAPPPPVVTTPPDSDHDGVPDSIDRCPNTPPGVAVDQFGCPQKGNITLEGVTFETNKALLTVESRPVLDKVADGLVKHPRLRVELQGYTDSSGSPQYNLVLSRKRAEAVRDYLVSQHVSPDQLSAKGFGKANPVADNKTAAGRAQNRRVVMKVVENPGDVNVHGEGDAKITE